MSRFIQCNRKHLNNVLGNAHFANAFEIHKAGLYNNKEGIHLGTAFGKRLILPGMESVLLVAPTGSGKTRQVAIPNALTWKGSLVLNDLKGELYALTATYRQQHLAQTCYCWAPADPQGSAHGFNPFYYISRDANLRIRDLQTMAEILIPNHAIGEPFWVQASREVFMLLSLYIMDTNGNLTLAHIHDLSKGENFFEWLEESVCDNAAVTHVTKQYALSLLQADDKTRRNILKDFHAKLSLFADPLIRQATNHNDFDLRQLRKNKMSIYIHIPDADKTRLAPILTLFWAQCIRVMTERLPDSASEPNAVLCLLDEFGNMTKIPQLKDGISFLRGYHVRLLLTVQYTAQLIAAYGQHDAKSFLNSKVKMCFALNDMSDATFFSKALGNKTVQVNSSSVNGGGGERASSTTQSTSLQSRPLLTPDELMQLAKKRLHYIMRITTTNSRKKIKVLICIALSILFSAYSGLAVGCNDYVAI